MNRSRKTKRYWSRSEFDLDVQIMRAHGWVPESIDDSAPMNSGLGSAGIGAWFRAGFPRRLSRFGKREESAAEEVNDMFGGSRIEVTYKRA